MHPGDELEALPSALYVFVDQDDHTVLAALQEAGGGAALPMLARAGRSGVLGTIAAQRVTADARGSARVDRRQRDRCCRRSRQPARFGRRLPSTSGKRTSVVDPTPFIWHELVTPDQPASGAFFTRLFGWTSREVDAGPFGTYTLFRSNGRDVAGMMNPTIDSPGGGAYWHSYIAVSDVDECARRAPVLGGKVLVAPHDVPEFGRVCAVADPAGAVAHLVQPNPGAG